MSNDCTNDCTDLEILRILLIVDHLGNALHSFDANDTLER